MGENATLSDFQGDGGQDVMVAAYRHDAHKLNGETHDYAPDTFHGVPVNQTVPHGADGDASALSRPNGKPEQTVDNHETHYRLSLLTGDSHYDPEEFSRPRLSEGINSLLTGSDRVRRDDPKISSCELLESDSERALGKYQTPQTEFHEFAESSALTVEFPVTVRNGWYRFGLTGTRGCNSDIASPPCEVTGHTYTPPR